MKRSLDPTPFNHIANDPEVRPWLGGQGVLNLAEKVENTANYCFLTPNMDGGYIVMRLMPGLYSAHTLALKSARGRPMLECMREGFATMFLATDCLEVQTVCPDGNENASRWAEVAGFREMFRRDKCFDLMGEQVGASFRTLDYSSWVLRDTRNALLGEQLHNRLHASGLADHPEDSVHDHWVGATLGGCFEGNTGKAIAMYNRWASLAGYHQAMVLSVNPPVVDTGDAIIQLISGQLEILKVKHAPRSALRAA